MKRTIFLLMACLSVASSAYSSTPVSGSIIGEVKWTKANSPYMIQGRVIVAHDSSLTIQPGVKVVVGPSSGLEVGGMIKVEGAAADPVVFQMSVGTYDSYLLINNARAEIVNTRFLGGAFVVRDSELRLEGCEIAKGSGVVMQGATAAEIRNNKIYGNATGLTLDGTIELEARFNTIVQNTYGLFVKDFNHIVFTNNSVHGNQQFEVVNASGKSAPLGGNYWSVDSWPALKPHVKGEADFDPLRSLKEVLRAYVKNMLPELPAGKAAELRKMAAKQKDEERRGTLAVKKRRAELARKERLAVLAAAKALTPVPTPTEVAVVEVAPVKEAEPAPVPETPKTAAKVAEAVAPAPKVETLMPTAPTGKSEVTTLPAAVRTLKPLTGLPPAQALSGDIPASSGKSPMSGIAIVPEPEAPAAVVPAIKAPVVVAPAISAPPVEAPVVEPPPMEAPSFDAPPAFSDADMAPPPDMGAFDIPPPPGGAAAAPALSVPAPAAPAPAAPVVAPPVPTPQAAAPAPAADLPPDMGDLELPPMNDVDIPPPADLELPKGDDLSNFNLD